MQIKLTKNNSVLTYPLLLHHRVGRNLARALAFVLLRVLPHMLHHELEVRQSDGVCTRSKFPLLKLKPRTVKYNFCSALQQWMAPASL